MKWYTREARGGCFSGDAALASFGSLSTWVESHLRKTVPISHHKFSLLGPTEFGGLHFILLGPFEIQLLLGFS